MLIPFSFAPLSLEHTAIIQLSVLRPNPDGYSALLIYKGNRMILYLAKKEMAHFSKSFLAMICAVAIAATVLILQLGVLKSHDLETERLLEQKEQALEKGLKSMENEYRKIMLKLGLNLIILPENQQRENYYAKGYADKFMPESYIDDLSKSNIITVRHLLPMVEQKIRWEERGGRPLILIGIRGEVPFTEKKAKKPIVTVVDPGMITLGFEIWNSLSLKSGDTLTLKGETFTIDKCHKRRNSKDDISAWVDLEKAQSLLGLKDKLSGIMALQCFCKGWNYDHLEFIKTQIPKILPETEVLFFKNKVTARAEARRQARITKENTLRAERAARGALRKEIETLASWITPLISLIALLFIVFLNWRDCIRRRQEIAILAATGKTHREILCMILIKPLTAGILGVAAGVGIGWGAMVPLSGAALTSVVSPGILAALICLIPCLTLIAGTFPALFAVGVDPATLFREE